MGGATKIWVPYTIGNARLSNTRNTEDTDTVKCRFLSWWFGNIVHIS